MALTDINFQEGEGQPVLVELALGTLNAPVDILLGASEQQYPVEEIAGGTNIFVISE